MTREKRLGRGLEALLGRADESEEQLAGMAPRHAPVPLEDLGEGWVSRDESGQTWLSVEAIDRNPFQPREDFGADEIESLRASIVEHGVIQPLVVRRVDDRFQLVTGERRLRAAKAAGWQRVPVQLRQADDRQMAELAIVENVQRKDLNPLEKAASFQRYIETYGCTQEELASRIHLDRSTIANFIRLLDLPAAVKEALLAGRISQGHARALLPLGEEREQVSFARRIVEAGLTVRATEEAVQDHIRAQDSEPLAVISAEGERSPVPRTRSAHVASLEQELKESLGTKVEIRQTSRGKGRIIIHFTSAEEFERLQSSLCSSRGRQRGAA
jgi:ParB family chromosome partitioning protein